MTEKNSDHPAEPMPKGFTQQSGGLASEYAREQGWGLLQDERSKTPAKKQDYDGGTDYEYGARDFGDSAVDTSANATNGNRDAATNPQRILSGSKGRSKS